jgi:pyochelin synthetase
MNIVNIISDFEALGIYLWTDKGQLKFKAPSGVMNDTRKQTLSLNKEALVEYLCDPVMDTVQSDPENKYKPFPLTDLQLAYLVGRNNVIEYGGVGCHSYIELDLPELEHEQLQQAWHELVLRHDMLRAKISTEGHQQIMPKVPSPGITLHQLGDQSDSDANKYLLQLRENLAHKCYQPENWPQYELHLSKHRNGSILHFSIDLLIADFASIQILLAELGERYNNPLKELNDLNISYRDVVVARKKLQSEENINSRYTKHKEYWLNRIKSLPEPPELPLAPNHNRLSNDQSVTFSRLHFELDEQQWNKIIRFANERKLTPSSTVLSAFTETLGRWANKPEFCLNLTMLNRSTSHPDIRGLVGDFIEVNVLGVTPNKQDGFTKRAQTIQKQLWQDLEHSDFSGIDVLRELSKQKKSNVIVPIVYTSTVGLSGDGLDSNEFMHDAKLRYGITQTPQVWLDCQVTQRNGKLIVHWDIREGIFIEGVIQEAHKAFCRLLTNLSQDESLWNSPSPVTLSKAMLAVRSVTHSTDAPLPKTHLHTAFCLNALNQPDKTAVIYNNVERSYIDLARQALAIKEKIQSKVKSGDRVGIVMDKSAHQIAAVFAILLCDATYVPIEGSLPVNRINIIIEDANIEVILTQQKYVHNNWPRKSLIVDAASVGLLEIKETTKTLQKTVALHAEQSELTKDKIGYIIYTSGTTGKPKGVMVSHLAALNTVLDVNHRFKMTAEDKTLGLVSFSFDLSVWDIFGTLSAGATLVLPDNDKRADPEHWAQIMQSYQVTRWNSVPAQMQMLMTSLDWVPEVKLHALKTVMMSGDWIPVQLPGIISSRLPNTEVISLGGPTETAIWCVSYPVVSVPDYAINIPYGLPMQNHQIHILNHRLETCPDWATGEMYIAGAGLAQGYANDIEKTNEKFIFHPVTQQRLYRSGDLGRYRPDGIIEILGRDDGQIKINGHRIEVSEVESALTDFELIREAAVVKIDSSLQLAAMVVCEKEGDRIKDMLAHLSLQLPSYMIPTVIEACDALPLNQNGKIDRKAIQMFFDNTEQRNNGEYVAPLDNKVEIDVAKIWGELLKTDRISRNDDFFQVGGSSLTAINLLSKLLAAGYSADIDLIFNNANFKDMVAALEDSNTKKEKWLAEINLQNIAENAMNNIENILPFDANKRIEKVLLTGATGFLGTYILQKLLQNTDYHIFCLIRCSNSSHGLERLRQAAQEKGLTVPIDRARLTIVPGELSEPKFGLSEALYKTLANEVDTIVHNASIINLMDPLSALYPTNVGGANRVLELASTTKIKPIHYVSTIGVHHALPDNIEQPVVEQTSVVEWRNVELTYEQSKIMAETLFGHAREKGVPVNILRPGTITWDTTASPYINDDAFLKFYKACLKIRAYPESALAVNIVPVDYVAECIAAIVQTKTGASDNFHLVSETSTQVEEVYGWCNELGCIINPLSFENWTEKLDDNFVQSFVNLYFREGMEGGGHHQYATTNMRQILSTFNITPFEVCKDYLTPLTLSYNNYSK